jgi:hypothetical protein
LFPLRSVVDNAATEAEPPKRKRRWYQFSLRTLLIFTLICAVSSAWVASTIERKRREWEAAKAIAKAGGEVYWDYQRVNGQLGHWQPNGAEPFGPTWLRGVLGENFFSEVDHVACEGGVENLKEFPRLRSLFLVSAGISDSGLEVVEELTELQKLSLIDTQVSDAMVSKLRAALSKCNIRVIHQSIPPLVTDPNKRR